LLSTSKHQKVRLSFIQDHHYPSRVAAATTLHCVILKQLPVQNKSYLPSCLIAQKKSTPTQFKGLYK